MDENSSLTVRERRGRDRWIWRTGLAVSVLAHALVFLFWQAAVIPTPDSLAAGPAAGDDRAAAGGMQAVNIRAEERPPVRPPPEPTLVAFEVEPVEFDDEPAVDPASLAGEIPSLEPGPGLEEGSGAGNAGDAESGERGLRPPAPQGMIIPPTQPDLRGSEIEVWVFVDERGRVVSDSTRLDPPTGDRGFNRRLIEEAAEWVFRPATLNGSPVAAWFPYRIIM